MMYSVTYKNIKTKHTATFYTHAESEKQAREFCGKAINKMGAEIIRVVRA